MEVIGAMTEMLEGGQTSTSIDVPHAGDGIEIEPCTETELNLANRDKYILLKDCASELTPLFGEIPNVERAIANYKVLGQTMYSITFNGRNVSPSSLFQKNNGAFLSNLKAESGVGFGKQADIMPVDFKGAQALNVANASLNVISAATATYFLKSINDKLFMLQDTVQDILGFLEDNKAARIKSEYESLMEIIREIDDIKNDDKLLAQKGNTIEQVKNHQSQDIIFYKNQIKKELEQYQDCKNSKKRDDIVARLRNYYECYRFCLQIFASARIADAQLMNHKVEHITNVKYDLLEKKKQFDELHDQLLDIPFSVRKSKLKTKIPAFFSDAAEWIANTRLADTPIAQRIGVSNKANDIAKKQELKAWRYAARDSSKILGEGRFNRVGLESIHSVAKQPSIESMLDIISSIEAAYNNSMKMIIHGDDVYLEIVKS